MIQVSLEFLGTLLGKTPGEITEALKDGEEFKPQSDVESYIKENFDAAIHKTKTSYKKQGFDWGKKAFLTEKEKELREKFGVEGDSLDEIIDAAVEAASTNSRLNPDDVKNSEIFQNEVKRLKQIIKEKDDEIANKVQSFEQKETGRVLREEGMKLLKKANFVLPEEEEIREELLDSLFSRLEDADTRIKLIDGHLVPVDSNGRPKDNPKGTDELSFEEHLVSKAKRYFKVAVADNRQSPANKTAEKKIVTDPSIPVMKTQEEYLQALSDERDPVKAKQIKEAWENSTVKDGETV